MADPKYPLSGDVTQAINPWTLWIKSVSTQTGFINIRNLNTGDAAIEQEIVENVAGYGRQLGRITDALGVLVAEMDSAGLNEKDRAAIDSFRAMAADIREVKLRRRSPARFLAALDSLLAELRELRDENPALYERAARRVREGVPPARPVEGTARKAAE